MPKHRQSDTPDYYLLSEVNVAQPSSGDSSMPRKFSGVANSGKPFVHMGQLSIVDLSKLSYKDKVPALLLHERGQRVGFGELSVADNQLVVEGTLLDNAHGREIAQDADAGFPWQMSAHVIPTSVKKLQAGQTEQVNGQTVTGPIQILRESKVAEISFTPTGVDSETSAVVLGDDGKPTNKPIDDPEKENIMTPEEIAALKKSVEDLKEEVETLKKQKQELLDEKVEIEKEKHEAAVEAQLSQAGFKKTETGEGWNGISAGTINVLLSSDIENAKAIIADLKPKAAPNEVPGWLMSEQHPPADNAQDIQLSSNPIIANAAARSTQQQNYI